MKVSNNEQSAKYKKACGFLTTHLTNPWVSCGYGKGKKDYHNMRTEKINTLHTQNN